MPGRTAIANPCFFRVSLTLSTLGSDHKSRHLQDRFVPLPPHLFPPPPCFMFEAREKSNARLTNLVIQFLRNSGQDGPTLLVLATVQWDMQVLQASVSYSSWGQSLYNSSYHFLPCRKSHVSKPTHSAASAPISATLPNQTSCPSDEDFAGSQRSGNAAKCSITAS